MKIFHDGNLLGGDTVSASLSYSEHLTASTMADLVFKIEDILYPQHFIFSKGLEHFVDECARSTPHADDVFLHSLCVNKVSDIILA
jgi:hypothetical protein